MQHELIAHSDHAKLATFGEASLPPYDSPHRLPPYHTHKRGACLLRAPL